MTEHIGRNIPFKERLNQLFIKGILYENGKGKRYILQNESRIAVIANLNGVKIPFYQSSTGTGGKVSGAWYPFFGNKGAWLIKGNIEKDLNKGYHIPEIQEMMKYLDEILPEYLYNNLLTKEQVQVFSDAFSRKGIGKLQNTTRPDIYKEFVINQDEAGKYMAKILDYNLNDAPDDESDPKTPAFLKKMIQSIKIKNIENKFN